MNDSPPATSKTHDEQRLDAIGNGIDQPDDWKYAVQEHLANGDRDAAFAVFDRVLKAEPRNARALALRGRLLVELEHDRFSEGAADIDLALSIAPDDPEVLGAKAAVLDIQGDYDKALRMLNDAVKVAPTSSVALGIRAVFYHNHGKNDEALADLAKAVELTPDDYRVYEARGLVRYTSRQIEAAIGDLSRALELQPNSPRSLSDRASAWMDLGRFESALKDFDQYVQLFPGSAAGYAARAEAHVRSGDYQRGINDLLMAIQNTPGDAGVDYVPSTGKELAADALRHGEVQFEAMLHDRPEMARHVVQGDALWAWAARKFAGEDVGEPILWDSAVPSFAAQHIQPHDGAPGRISIHPVSRYARHAGRPARFEQLWTAAVFELHNIALGEGFRRVQNDLQLRRLTREQYVKAMMEVEHGAAQQTRAFYAHVFLPWAIKTGFQGSDPSIWCKDVGHPNWVDRWRPGDKYWDHYATAFDLFQARRAYEQGDYAVACSLLESVLSKKNVLDGEWLAHAHHLLATCQMRLGEKPESQHSINRAQQIEPTSVATLVWRAYLNLETPEKAVVDLDRAIELAPDNANAYLYRGIVRQRMGDLNGALLDYDQHLRLKPDSIEGYSRRGRAWMLKENFKKSLTDFKKVIVLDPSHVYALDTINYINVVSLHERSEPSIALNVPKATAPSADLTAKSSAIAGEALKYFHRALAGYSQDIEKSPQDPDGYYLRALLLLSCPNTELRDTQRAIEDARRACELTAWKSAEYLSLLADAHAADRNLDAAIEWQSKALELAVDEEKASHRRRLDELRQ